MLTINAINKEDSDNLDFVRIASMLEITGRRPFKLWVETSSEWSKYLVCERADAFLVGILLYAMLNGQDITCKIPVTSELLYNLETYLIPTLTKYDKHLTRIKIYCEIEKYPISNAGAVGTGCSMGVDCFNTLVAQYNSTYSGLSLTHLTTFNNGVFGGYYQKAGWDYAAGMLYLREQELAKELSLPLIPINTNLHQLVRLRGDLYAAYLMTLNILSLGKLFKTYFYSSAGWDFGKFTVIPNSQYFDCAHYDLLSLNCFSVQDGIRFYSEGGEKNRLEKIESFADFPLAQRYLQSCLTQTFNCGVCLKCKRNLLSLDALGALDKFRSVYDIDYYMQHREEYLEWMCQQIAQETHAGNVYMKPIYDKIQAREPETISKLDMSLGYEALIADKNRYKQSSDLWKKCNRLFRSLCENPNSIQEIAKFFRDNSYVNIILYGNNELTQFFYNMRNSFGITVSHIVEDTNLPHRVARLPLNTVNYPQADAIIICNLRNPELEYKKLEQRVNMPIYQGYDVLTNPQKAISSSIRHVDNSKNDVTPPPVNNGSANVICCYVAVSVWNCVLAC